MPIYLPDTNLFRYLDNNDMGSYKQAAQAFFSKAQKEQTEGRSITLLSEEVKCELEVQMHTLKDRKKRILQVMLEQATVSANLPIQLEHDLRKFSNYIRSPKINSVFNIPDYKTGYLRTSDARILVNAYVNDATLEKPLLIFHCNSNGCIFYANIEGSEVKTSSDPQFFLFSILTKQPTPQAPPHAPYSQTHQATHAPHSLTLYSLSYFLIHLPRGIRGHIF